MAQRWPSTDTSFPRGVPLGHQVEKKASAPSALYWRATPHEALPCFKKPVSSMTPTACSSASVSSAYSRTMSRNASASRRAHPARLARLVAQKPVQKLSRRPCHSFLAEQWANPHLHLPQRRRPQLQGRLNRCTSHP